MVAECWLQGEIRRQQLLRDHKQEAFCQRHESNCQAWCCSVLHGASSRCYYYSRQTCISALQKVDKLELRLSHSGSLITSKRFQVSSGAKTSNPVSFFLCYCLITTKISSKNSTFVVALTTIQNWFGLLDRRKCKSLIIIVFPSLSLYCGISITHQCDSPRARDLFMHFTAKFVCP